MKFDRAFAMPSADTFSIPPIGDFVKRYLHSAVVSVDPFARNKRWATYTNDLSPDTMAEHHMDARDFCMPTVRPCCIPTKRTTIAASATSSRTTKPLSMARASTVAASSTPIRLKASTRSSNAGCAASTSTAESSTCSATCVSSISATRTVRPLGSATPNALKSPSLASSASA